MDSFQASPISILTLFQSIGESVSSRTRSVHYPTILPNLPTTKWISVTELQSFCQHDAFSDWLTVLRQTYDKSYQTSANAQSDFLLSLFQKGKEHEEFIIKQLRERTGLSLPSYSSHVTSRAYNDKDGNRDVERVKARMQAGDPIIYSAYLQAGDLRGIPDLLIRNDYIPTLFPELYEIAPGQSHFGNYYYLPVEIKFSSVHLASNGIHVLNRDRTHFYKTQLETYSFILSEIQGFYPKQAFLIGKRTIHTENVYDSLDRPGFIDYSANDSDYVTIRQRGLDWLRMVKKNGSTWTMDEMIQRKCFPNMKVEHSSRQIEIDKKEIADSYGEITTIWQCGHRQRTNAIEHGIHSTYDPTLTSQHLGVPQPYQETVDRILAVNRGDYGDYYPEHINQSEINLGNNEMFVDFETLRDAFEVGTHAISTEWIFLIGVYYRGTYVSFRLTDLQSERDVIGAFYNYWVSAGKPVCWYWYAEQEMWRRAMERCGEAYAVKWVDLCAILQSAKFVVRGCSSFKLKDVLNALRKMGYVTLSPPPKTCGNGMDAMIAAWQYYSQPFATVATSQKMADVLEYNRFDCMAVERILTFLRTL